MSGNLSNTSVFGTDNYEEIQLQYEEMSREKVKNGHIHKDVYMEDDYEVDCFETWDDLCDIGFVVINGKCVKRD